MGDLHIAGFEVPVAREAFSFSSSPLGGGGVGVTGRSLGGHIATTEEIQAGTPLIPAAEARAIEALCRAKNGAVWHCNNSLFSSAGLSLTTTPTFQASEKKFGTHAISLASAASHVSVCTVGALYTVSAWVKVGAGAWQHQILRSDGAKWVNAARNDAATLSIAVATNVFELQDDGAATTYFDELVWLPFEIYADWGADWPQAEVFSDLPDLDITGDLLGGYRVNDATARARVSVSGVAFGTRGATVQIDITGPEREVDP